MTAITARPRRLYLMQVAATPAPLIAPIVCYLIQMGDGRNTLEEDLRISTRKLLDLVQREQVTLVIFGHDAEQWQTLKKAPDYYG